MARIRLFRSGGIRGTQDRRGASASFSVEVRVDESSLKRIENELAAMPNKIKTAQVSAINRTLRTGRTIVNRKIRKISTLKNDVVKRRVVVSRKAKKTKTGTPYGVLLVLGQKIALLAFQGSPKEPPNFAGMPNEQRRPKGGASYRIYRGGPRIRPGNLFTQRGSTSGRVSLMRHFRKENRLRVGRRRKTGEAFVQNRMTYNVGPVDSAIRLAYGPGPVEILEKHGINRITVDLAAVLEKNVDSQINRFLNRRVTRG